MTASEAQDQSAEGLVQEAMQDLRKVFKALQSYSTSAESEFGVTGPQLWAIWEMGRRPQLPLKDLAAAMHLSPSTVVGIVDRLVAKGLVLRETDATDRRRIKLSLTPQGQEILGGAPNPAQEQMIKGLSTLSREDLVAFCASLSQIVRAMSAERLHAPFFFADE